MKLVESHSDGLKPFFDVGSTSVIRLTSQLMTCKGGQIARTSDKNIYVSDAVFLVDYNL
jgi:hypothetical protein